MTDASDATVPSANVKVTNEETGSEYNTACDGLGNFIVPSLLPGRYTMTVSHEGFTVFIQNGITLQVDQRPQIEVNGWPNWAIGLLGRLSTNHS
jgi:hypothetical protein